MRIKVLTNVDVATRSNSVAEADLSSAEGCALARTDESSIAVAGIGRSVRRIKVLTIVGVATRSFSAVEAGLSSAEGKALARNDESSIAVAGIGRSRNGAERHRHRHKCSHRQHQDNAPHTRYLLPLAGVRPAVCTATFINDIKNEVVKEGAGCQEDYR